MKVRDYYRTPAATRERMHAEIWTRDCVVLDVVPSETAGKFDVIYHRRGVVEVARDVDGDFDINVTC